MMIRELMKAVCGVDDYECGANVWLVAPVCGK